MPRTRPVVRGALLARWSGSGAGAGKSKGFDQGNVLGPCIVRGELDPVNIDIVLHVDGEERARGNTSGMEARKP